MEGPAIEQCGSQSLVTAKELERRIQQGADEGDARCGVVEILGLSVAAAFVGATASALALAEVLRPLHEGPSYSVLAIDLRSPDPTSCTINSALHGAPTWGYTLARTQ